MTDQTLEAFARAVRADAEAIFVTRAGKTLRLSQLSKADQNAHIDRWFADGVDPVADLRNAAGAAEALKPDLSKPPLATETRKTLSASQPIAGSDEMFFGWVCRSLEPSGFEWIRISIPRHVAEALAVPDKIGRRVRKDTREVMTGQIIGELGDWNLANRTRSPR